MESFEPKVLALYLTRHGSEKMKEMVSLSPVSSLVGMESSTYEFERKAIQNHPDILFIEYDPAFPGLVDLIERLTRSLPKGVVVAYASETDPEGIVKAMRVGVREFLSGNEQPDAFNEAVLRLGRQVAPDGQRPGRLLARDRDQGRRGLLHPDPEPVLGHQPAPRQKGGPPGLRPFRRRPGLHAGRGPQAGPVRRVLQLRAAGHGHDEQLPERNRPRLPSPGRAQGPGGGRVDHPGTPGPGPGPPDHEPRAGGGGTPPPAWTSRPFWPWTAPS